MQVRSVRIRKTRFSMNKNRDLPSFFLPNTILASLQRDKTSSFELANQNGVTRWNLGRRKKLCRCSTIVQMAPRSRSSWSLSSPPPPASSCTSRRTSGTVALYSTQEMKRCESSQASKSRFIKPLLLLLLLCQIMSERNIHAQGTLLLHCHW